VDQVIIHRLISVLTKNEDLRQDLWVSYLSGEIDSTFSSKLQQLSISKDIEQKASNSLQDILDLNISQDVLGQLSDLQCSILFMTILGYNLEQVGRYNQVEQVVIDEEMVSLTKHPVWVQHGTQASSKSRRKVRSH
jgi:hypothetical protein